MQVNVTTFTNRVQAKPIYLLLSDTFWDFRQFPGSIGWPTQREHGAKNFFGAIGGLTLEQVPLRLK